MNTTLPNFDYKFMQGNSLISTFDGEFIDLSTDGTWNGIQELKSLKNCLNRLQRELFILNGDDKLRKEIEIKQCLLQIIHLRFDYERQSWLQNNVVQNDLFESPVIVDNAAIHVINGESRGYVILEKVRELQCLLSDNTCSLQERAQIQIPFFDWQIMFSDVFNQGGFDIVIGNPPYIGEKGHKPLFDFVKQDKNNIGSYYLGKMDFFYFFFHLALNMLKEDGKCVFITTNYYVTAYGAKTLRKDLYERSTLTEIINFNELKIFPSAKGQHNMITFLEKGRDNKPCYIYNTSRTGELTKEIFDIMLSRNDRETVYNEILQNDLYDGVENYIRITKEQEGSYLFNILSKISCGNDILGNVSCVASGIISGCDYITKLNLSYTTQADISQNDIRKGDGVFVLDEENPRDVDIIKGIKHYSFVKAMYKNSDIKKYYTSTTPTKYLIFSSPETPEKDENAIAKILERFTRILIRIRQINRESESLCYKNRRGTSRKEIYTLPKIVCPYRSRGNIFGYNECEWFASNDVYYVVQTNDDYKLKYLLGLLNSKLYYVWLYNNGKRKGDMLEMYQKPLSEIPIKKASKEQQDKIISLVDQILDVKSVNPEADTKDLEHQIDLLVYKLYGITDPKEIEIIEGVV